MEVEYINIGLLESGAEGDTESIIETKIIALPFED